MTFLFFWQPRSTATPTPPVAEAERALPGDGGAWARPSEIRRRRIEDDDDEVIGAIVAFLTARNSP